MKNFFLLIAVMGSHLLSAQSGKVMDNLTLQSKILGMERKYAIYFPADYEISSRQALPEVLAFVSQAFHQY